MRIISTDLNFECPMYVMRNIEENFFLNFFYVYVHVAEEKVRKSHFNREESENNKFFARQIRIISK